jgi:DNA-binding MarR family transcriptional regulator
VRQVLVHYPRIFFACHTRHVRDPKTRRLLSAHQAGILDHLDLIEPTTLMGLARHMGVTPSTMSLAIDRLERRGYVVRSRDPRDRRRSALRLSAAGERIRQAQSVLEPGRVADMLSMLSREQLGRALEGLALLGRAADRYLESGPAKRLVGLRRQRRK